jgi:hypothetical protein
MQDDLSDRRRSPRIPCDLSVEYEERGARTQQGRIANIGITGTLLKTQAASPPVGVELFIRFRLPLSNRPVQTVATVRWAAQWSAGVEFVHLNFQEQDEIWRYYARELARQRKPDAWRRPKLGSE